MGVRGSSAGIRATLGNDIVVVEELSELFTGIDNRNAGTGWNQVLLASDFDRSPVVEMTANDSNQTRISHCRCEIQARGWLARSKHPYEAGRAAKTPEGLAVDQMAIERSERTTGFEHRDIHLVERTDDAAAQHRNVPLSHRLNPPKQSSEEHRLPDYR